MLRKSLLSVSLCLFAGLFAGYGTGLEAQESPDLHVVVNLVQLNVAVTDRNGNYVTGLRPQDFSIVEDGIAQKMATFAEGNEPALSLMEPKGSADPAPDLSGGRSAGDAPQTLDTLVAGANVFVLFDTSNFCSV